MKLLKQNVWLKAIHIANLFPNYEVTKMVRYVKSPFAMQRDANTGTEREVAEPLEIAMALCDIELQRDTGRFNISKLQIDKLFKGKLFGGKHSSQKPSFIIEAYWPIWLVPFDHEKSLIIDGLGLFSRVFYHPEIPDIDEFIKDISVNEGNIEKFETSMDRYRFRHRHFVDMRPVTISGIIPHEGLIHDLLAYIHLSWSEVSEEPTMLNPRLPLAQAKKRTEEFISLKKACERDIEKLNLADKALLNSVSEYIKQVDVKKQQIEEQYTGKIAEFQMVINNRVTELMRSCQAEADIVITNANMKLDNLKHQLQEQETKESEFQSRIESNQSKIFELKRRLLKAGEHETGYLRKAIADMEAAVSRDQEELTLVQKQKLLLKNESEVTENDRERRLAAIRTRYDVQIKSERDKIMDLFREKDKLLVALEDRKSLIQERREEISEQILQLRERLKDYRFVELEKGCVTIPPRLADVQGVLLPIYIARFETGESGRYVILPPSIVSKEQRLDKLKGLIIKSTFLEARTKNLSEILSEAFRQVLQKDAELNNEIHKKAETANLLKNAHTKDLFNEGLLLMKEQGWVSDGRYKNLKSTMAFQFI
jgi:phage host-nuclease inhibitor protein Gam